MKTSHQLVIFTLLLLLASALPWRMGATDADPGSDPDVPADTVPDTIPDSIPDTIPDTIPEQPKVALFLGNSIASLWLQQDRQWFADNDIVNTGIGGETSRQILLRAKADIDACQPRVVVIISPQTNDVAQNEGPVTIEQMTDNVRQMVDAAQESGAVTIIASNLPCNYFFWRPEMTPGADIVAANEALKQLARETHCPYIDLHTPMTDDGLAFNELYSYDGCHPTAEGFEMMRKLIMPLVNEIRGAHPHTFILLSPPPHSPRT